MLQRLTQFLRSKPFIPFRVILTTGTHYDVLSPPQLAIGKSEFVYYFPKSNRLAHLRLHQIASLETLESAAA